MPKIEKDLLKVKGSDGQWHYIPAVGGGDTPTWEMVQNKPFSTLGSGLEVDENGVLSAEGGGGSANAVQYVAQTLTDEQKTQARTNIDADKKRIVVEARRSSGGSTMVYYNVDDQNAAIDKFIAEYKAGTEILLRLYNRDYPLTNIDEDGIVYFAGYIYDAANKSVGVIVYKMEKNKAVVEESSLYGIKAISLDNQLKYKGYAADAKAVGDALGTKLDKNQGTGNAGKILGVGEDGIVVPQDKPTYTLPQATADALGGIKADAATDEDTQDVRIGADGKMRTKPYTLTDADKTAVADKVVAGGIAATLVDLPSGGGGGGAWTKILETEVTEATATFEVTGLDNYTEFLVINSGLQNATSTDSVQNLYINGAQVCANFVDVPKSGRTTYNYAIARFNGIVWECHKPNVAASATNLAPSIAYIPYNVVFGVGKATSIKAATANTTYAPVSGKITIYGR